MKKVEGTREEFPQPGVGGDLLPYKQETGERKERVKRTAGGARAGWRRSSSEHKKKYQVRFLFFILFIILALLSSRSFLAVTQIRGHIAGPPPPSPHSHYEYVMRSFLLCRISVLHPAQ